MKKYQNQTPPSLKSLKYIFADFSGEKQHETISPIDMAKNVLRSADKLDMFMFGVVLEVFVANCRIEKAKEVYRNLSLSHEELLKQNQRLRKQYQEFMQFSAPLVAQAYILLNRGVLPDEDAVNKFISKSRKHFGQTLTDLLNEMGYESENNLI